VLRRIPENKSGLIVIGSSVFGFNNQSLTVAGKNKNASRKRNVIFSGIYADTATIVIKREKMLKELGGENDYLKEDPAISVENVFGVGFIFNVPAGKR